MEGLNEEEVIELLEKYKRDKMKNNKEKSLIVDDQKK